MRPNLLALLVAIPATLGLAACGGTTDPRTDPVVTCDAAGVTALIPGQAINLEAGSTGACVRLGAAQGAAAEYLITAYSANGREQAGGASGSFSLVIGRDTLAALRAAAVRRTGLGSFHDRLRARELELGRGAFATPPGARVNAPPVIEGDTRTFQVCANLECNAVVGVKATARYVGSHGAVFVDDTVPAGGYTQAEVDSVGLLFDEWIYPVDTTAFGRESDIDGNGQVLVLLTDQLNRLSGNCNATGQLVVGYFFGLDLTTEPGSNQGEVFYGMVPDPGSTSCPVDHALARRLLAPVFIHEFQHMISWNHHVLQAGGRPEETWLNEGLSHFAEELGGRRIPNALCVDQNCLNQFARSDILNAYDYLRDPENYYLVEPGISFGALPERGANWLFVRWLADQAPGDSALGTAVTRALLGANGAGTALTGGANVEQAATLFAPGATIADLLADWHAANYLESRTDVPPSGRLHYRSWNLGNAFGQLVFTPYPFRPDSVTGGYRREGTLLGGSGRTVRLLQSAGDPPIAVRLTATQLVLAQPRLAIRRIR